MAYGLKVFAEDPTSSAQCTARGGTWNSSTNICSGFSDLATYDSTTDGGFVYIGRIDFGTSGSGAGTYSVTAPDITEIDVIYLPYIRRICGGTVADPLSQSPNTGRPSISVGTKSGNNFPITVTLAGPSNLALEGGSLEIFGR